MKCSKCREDFPEHLIQNSHDIPKYMGGTDADGRHYLCQKCHDIYERFAFAVAWKNAPEYIQIICRKRVKEFSIKYFKEVKKDGDTNTQETTNEGN